MRQSGEARQLAQLQQTQKNRRWPEYSGAVVSVVVVLVWLLASWSAPAAELILSATTGPIANNRATVTASYTSSGYTNTMIRLYVNSKRWGSSDMASGSWQIADLPVGTHKLIARADGVTPQWSNEVIVQIGSVPLAIDPKRRDAARLLMQASFGPRSVADIDEVAGRAPAAWIESQFSTPWNMHAGYLANLRGLSIKVEEQHIFEAIWQNMMFADARLRSRVALALSEIMVVSNIAPDQDTDALAFWMDTLYKNAFGNYRTLLRDVTLQPAMGYYLNMLGNDKEDPAKGRMPSENYAREVLQLFSIGLVQLNDDGTAKRDANGKTIPTYDQNVVQGFAKVFTGWSFGGNDTSFSDGFNPPKQNWTLEMQAWPSHHSTATKLLLNGVTLPAGQTPERDLNDALDNIANHPNVGPFMSKRLIQFLVTSNPSPAYVSRVVAVWNNNGSGVRGDLKSVVRAILLDSEARDASSSTGSNYGKLREPMVRFVHFANAMGAVSKNGRNSIWWLDSPDDALGQTPLLAASVFNFFSPFYSRAGSIAQAGLVSPEFQNATDTQVVGSTNFFSRIIRDGGIGFDDVNRVDFDATTWLADASTTSKLLDRMNWVLFAGGMSASTQAILEKAINAFPASQRNNRLQAALNLAVIAPEFVVQR
jgi:endo-chitodextinase